MRPAAPGGTGRRIDAEHQTTSRVLVLTPQLNDIGGVGNYYRALELERHDSRVDYFPVTAIGPETTLQFVARLVRNYLRFWKLLGSGRYRLVVLNPSLDPRAFFRDAVFFRLARARRVRVVVFFRGWAPEFENKLKESTLPKLVFSLTLAKASDFIVLGRVFRDKLLSLGVTTESRFWIESTLADATYLHRFPSGFRTNTPGELKLLFLARLMPSKRPQLAVEAFHLAQKRRPDLTLELVIAGPGPEFSRLRHLIEAEGISNITLAGPVRDMAKAELLARSHVLLFPTEREGMPNAILEAMLYGMPVLSTTVGAIPEIVEHGINGFIADAPDAETFAEWIILLATNMELRQRMALANRQKAARLYTVENVRSRFLAILDECLAQ